MHYQVPGKVLVAQKVDHILDLILVQRGGLYPYVTWLYNHEDKAPHHGHYFKHISEAIEDFERRMASYR